MNDTELTRILPSGEAFFVLGSIAMRRGGVTRAVLARTRLYADAGIKVRLLLTGHSFHEDSERANVLQAWGLPDSVEVRYFWREAAPGGGGAEVDPLVRAAHEPGLASFSEVTASGTVVRLSRDGTLVKTKHFDPAGRLQRIMRHDPECRPVSRENFDVHGRLVLSEEIDPGTGKPKLRHWFDRSGACWLTSRLSAAGYPTATVRHRPSSVAYDHFGQCVALWVDDVLAASEAPLVFADRRNQDHVLLALTHPGARRVAVLHNCHTIRPHRVVDAARAEWLPLLENLGAFDTVIALTHQQGEDIARRYGAANLTVINHPTPPAPKLQVSRQPGLLVAIARLVGQKRLGHAIRAFALAAPRVPGARFDIYGTGPQAPALESLVSKLGIADRVQFRGFTDRSSEIFASASAVVLSSSFEGFPLVLNEAMGVGTPFVAYDINYGPAEVIRHQVDGLLVPPGDIEALADAMVRLLGHPDYAAELGERAREVAERFSVERWTTEWMDLFAGRVASPIVGHGPDRANPPATRATTAERMIARLTANQLVRRAHRVAARLRPRVARSVRGVRPRG